MSSQLRDDKKLFQFNPTFCESWDESFMRYLTITFKYYISTNPNVLKWNIVYYKHGKHY